MIEETAVVVHIEQQSQQQYIWVETAIKTTCSSCQAQANCGTSVVAKAFANKKQKMKLACDLPVVIGQKVRIGIPEERLLSASVLVYLLPILGLISGSVFVSAVSPWLSLDSELWVILGGFTLATVVFLAVRRYLNDANQHRFCPQLLETDSSQSQAIDLKQL